MSGHSVHKRGVSDGAAQRTLKHEQRNESRSRAQSRCHVRVPRGQPFESLGLIAMELILLTLLAQASADFKVTQPALEAEVSLPSDQSWYLSGFCFGHADGEEVAKLILSFEAGEILGPEGAAPSGLYLVSFDGRKDRWGVAKRSWETSSCLGLFGL